MLSVAGIAAASSTRSSPSCPTARSSSTDRGRPFLPGSGGNDVHGGRQVGPRHHRPEARHEGQREAVRHRQLARTTDVMVHQELNAKVMAIAGNSLLIRGSKGVEKYEWTDASDITIVKDGKVVDASSIHVGDRITGMIVQKAAPRMTHGAGRRRPEARLRPRPPLQEGGPGPRSDRRPGSGRSSGSGKPRLPLRRRSSRRPRAKCRGGSPRRPRPRGWRGSHGDPQVPLREVTLPGFSSLRPPSRRAQLFSARRVRVPPARRHPRRIPLQ